MSEAPRKPVILVLMTYYLPGFKSGGPVRTLVNMIERLSDRYAFRVIARDRDLGDSGPYPGVEPGVWTEVGDAQVQYLRLSAGSVGSVVRAIRQVDYDVLYVNSYFDPFLSIVPLLARRLGLLGRKPVVLAPRGEMAPSALAQKPGKKRLFVGFSRLLGLHRGVVWQASSPYEQGDVTGRLGVPPERVEIAPDFPSLAGLSGAYPPVPHSPLRVAFVARIAAVKNLPFALDVMAAVDRDVAFNVYGTVEDRAYFEACMRQLEGVGERVTARYCGVLPHDEVSRVLAGHHLFFLPTMGENYGHAIAEALAVGTPVLISDRTPWRGLEAAGAGWDLPLADPRPFVDVIEGVADMSEAERASLRASTLRFAAERLQDPEVLRQNVALFERAMGRGPRS